MLPKKGIKYIKNVLERTVNNYDCRCRFRQHELVFSRLQFALPDTPESIPYARTPHDECLRETALTKLNVDYIAELDLAKTFPRLTALTKLIPYTGARAIAFGWASGPDYSHMSERYWFAEIRRDGVSLRVLPIELTERFSLLVNRSPNSDGGLVKIHAFKFGESVGLLLGTQEIQLFSDINAEPQVIEVENHFAMLGEPRYPTSQRDSYWLPEHCGNPTGNVVPVILSSPADNPGEGRHACLLEIDANGGKARWKVRGENNLPAATRREDFVPFVTDGNPGGARFDSQAGLVFDQPPVLTDCTWIDEHWRLYSAGFRRPHPRHGSATGPCVITRHRSDLSTERVLYQAGEYSLARLCASHDRAIVSPLNKSGPNKGRQTVFHFDGSVGEQPVALPRGYAKHYVEEFLDGTWWMLPMPIGFGSSRVIACSEA